MTLPPRVTDDSYAICPYCKYPHGDCWEWVSLEPRTTQCDECGKQFEVWATCTVSYHTRPIQETK